jgi:uncharacterized phage protein gp47/JayE
MADLKIQDFETLVRNQVLAIQGKSTSLVDLTVGSVLRAVVEAYSAIAIWLQAMILQIIAITRASTSSGSDLDTWMADFGVTRSPATISSGMVTFSRFTYSAQAIVPVGSIVQSSDGSQQYKVIADSTIPSFNLQLGGYVIPSGTPSLDVPVQSIGYGVAANASTGGINTLGQAIPGVDSVANALDFTNARDAESDYDFRKRFVAYVLSISKATKSAVLYASTSIKQGVTCKVIENENFDGSTNIGFFYVVVDDGTGSPSSDFLSFVYQSIDEVRPLSIRFAVFPPEIHLVNISMAISTADGYVHQDIASQVSDAISNYINTLGLGNALPYTKLAQIAYGVSDGVTNVTSIVINGGNSDIAVRSNQTIKVGSISIN